MKNNQRLSKGRGGRRDGAGRKAGIPNKANRDLKELAQAYTPEALKTLAAIMRDGESETARVAAANAILDRGNGKPGQHIAVDRNLTITDERIERADRILEESAAIVAALDPAGGPRSYTPPSRRREKL